MTKAEGPAEPCSASGEPGFKARPTQQPPEGCRLRHWSRAGSAGCPRSPGAGGGEQRSGRLFPGAKLLTSSYLLKIAVRQENARESAAAQRAPACTRGAEPAKARGCGGAGLPRALRPHLLPAGGAAQPEDTPHLPGSTHPPASTHRHQQNSVPPEVPLLAMRPQPRWAGGSGGNRSRLPAVC